MNICTFLLAVRKYETKVTCGEGEWFLLARGLRVQSVLLGKAWGQEWEASIKKQRRMLLLSPLSSLYSVQDPSSWVATAHIQCGSFHFSLCKCSHRHWVLSPRWFQIPSSWQWWFTIAPPEYRRRNLITPHFFSFIWHQVGGLIKIKILPRFFLSKCDLAHSHSTCHIAFFLSWCLDCQLNWIENCLED